MSGYLKDLYMEKNKQNAFQKVYADDNGSDWQYLGRTLYSENISLFQLNSTDRRSWLQLQS